MSKWTRNSCSERTFTFLDSCVTTRALLRAFAKPLLICFGFQVLVKHFLQSLLAELTVQTLPDRGIRGLGEIAFQELGGG